MDDVLSLAGRPQVFLLAGDDSDQFGDEEDTESVDGFEESVEGDEDVLHSIPDTVVEVAVPRGAVMREALQGLDGVDIRRIFSLRGAVMKGVPKFLFGPFRNGNLRWRRRQQVPQAWKWYVRREDGSC